MMPLRHLCLAHRAIGLLQHHANRLHFNHVWHDLLLRLLLLHLIGCLWEAPEVMVMLIKFGRPASAGKLLLVIQGLICMTLHRELRLMLQPL